MRYIISTFVFVSVSLVSLAVSAEDGEKVSFKKPSSTENTAASQSIRLTPKRPTRGVNTALSKVPLSLRQEVADDATYADLLQVPAIESFFDFDIESVCLPDSRQQVSNTHQQPWCVNCQLIIDLGGGHIARGTGWLIGPKTVITAGHCVHEGEGGNFFKAVEVIPGMNGTSMPFGSQVSSTLRASEQWKAESDAASDYGAIILDSEFKSLDGKPVGFVNAVSPDDMSLTGAEVRLAGYPGDKPSGTQWTDKGAITSFSPTRLRYMIDTFGGNSGCAVYREGAQGQPEVVGIHNYGGCPNKCTRITNAVLDELNKWKRESESP